MFRLPGKWWQQGPRGLALEGGEEKKLPMVEVQQDIDKSIAEATDTVKEYDGSISWIHGHMPGVLGLWRWTSGAW